MNPTFPIICALIFIAGLNIPRVSEYLLILTTLVLMFRWLVDMRVDHPAFFTGLSLLALFVLSYYAVTCIHEITVVNEGVRNILVILGSYALGYTISSNNTPAWPRGVSIPLFCMIAGLISFSALCVYAMFNAADYLQLVERTAASFWDGSEINAPGLGANASLGMCLLPVFLYGRSADCRGVFYWSAALVVVVMFAAGVTINVALQNRTPFLATTAALLAATAVYLYRQRSGRARAMRHLALLGLLAGIVVYYLATRIDLAQYGLFTRFTEERLESLRYEAWGTMLSSLHHSLLGGRVVKLGTDLNYVHNLWLDVIWDAGIVPFILLAAFHLKHLHAFLSILQSKLPLFVVLMIVGLAVSFVTNFMQEPTLSASVPYFAASCFFLGIVLRMGHDLAVNEDTP